MKRIGILGGTFNPIHLGHLIIAQMAQEQVKLEKIFFVPSNKPPHKSSRGVVLAKHRFNMVRVAIEKSPFWEVSDCEIKRGGRSYTIDTVRYFRDIFGQTTKLFFIIGGDMLSQLKTWKDINKIQKIVDFIAVDRPKYKRRRNNWKYYKVMMPGIDISSSYVRECIRKRRAIKYFVPDSVEKYIIRNNLYK